MNRWYNVHDLLPAIDAECIVLNEEGRISFAHMVDKAVAVDYDGWNIPNVVWWTHFTRAKNWKNTTDKIYSTNQGGLNL